MTITVVDNNNGEDARSRLPPKAAPWKDQVTPEKQKEKRCESSMDLTPRPTKHYRPGLEFPKGMALGLDAAVKIVDGKPFPLVLVPSQPSATPADLAAIISAERLRLQQLVAEYGAVLLRGWGPCGPQDFSNINLALHGDMDFDMSCSAGPRTQLAPGIFTANEAPPSDTIPFHHEMAQCSSPPAHVLFFCLVPAQDGGETPIIMSRLVTEFLRSRHPQLAEKLTRLGVRYIRVQPEHTDPSSALGKSWKIPFGETRSVAEETMAAEGFEWTWLPGGSLRTVSKVMTALAVDNRSGHEVFFTAAETTLKQQPLGKTPADEGSEQPCKGIIFGDGSELDESEKEALKQVGEFMDSHKVAFAWQAGDALILNNSTVMHAREDFVPPRRILVALNGRLQRGSIEDPILHPLFP